MDGLARSTQVGLTGQFFTVKFMDTVRHIPELDIRDKKVVFTNGEECLFSRKVKNDLVRLLDLDLQT